MARTLRGDRVGARVMLAPVSLIRNDLKQYTCDAFCALVLLGLGAWAERTASRRSLVWLAVAGVATAPFSSTALFVTFALFAGLLASALLARARDSARSRSWSWAA